MGTGLEINPSDASLSVVKPGLSGIAREYNTVACSTVPLKDNSETSQPTKISQQASNCQGDSKASHPSIGVRKEPSAARSVASEEGKGAKQIIQPSCNGDAGCCEEADEELYDDDVSFSLFG